MLKPSLEVHDELVEMVRVGDFNTSLPATNSPPQLERLELQVEGHGYVRTLGAGTISAPNITCASTDSQKLTAAVDLCAVAAEKDDTMAAVQAELSELRAERCVYSEGGAPRQLGTARAATEAQ